MHREITAYDQNFRTTYPVVSCPRMPQAETLRGAMRAMASVKEIVAFITARTKFAKVVKMRFVD